MMRVAQGGPVRMEWDAMPTPVMAITWPTFLAPQWAWLGLLAVPIILLYILRQKRPDTPVSSTLLWSKALSDMRASTPWQKLRRNLLLFLQLLLLAAIVLTLMRPVIRAKATQTLASVVVIDATASMQTQDGEAPAEGKPPVTRFDKALEETRKLINAMRPGDRMLIVVDGGGLNQSDSSFLTSKPELLSFVNGLKPSDCTSDLSESLILAATRLRGVTMPTDAATKSEVQLGKIYLMSDGGGIAVPPIIGESWLELIRVGTRGENVGVTRLAVAPARDEEGQLKPRTFHIFAEVFNASDRVHSVSVGLAIGKQNAFRTAATANVPARGSAPVTFENIEADPGPFFVVLDDKVDDLPVDNVAFGVVPATQKLHVVMVTASGEENILDKQVAQFLRAPAHTTTLRAEVMPVGAVNAQSKADLFIFNGVAPADADLPRGDLLFIRPPGSVGGFVLREALKNPLALRSKEDAPEMISVERQEMRINQARRVESDPAITELVSTHTGPLIAYRDVGLNRRYILAFAPVLPDSDWAQYSSFPIFMENLLDGVKERHFVGLPQIISTGATARVGDVAADATIDVLDAKGEHIVRDQPLGKYVKDGGLEYQETDKTGLYTIHSGEKEERFGVNLLSQVESDVMPQTLKNSSGGNISEARSVADVNREIWQYVAAVALLVLLVEWIVYHRRVA